MTDDQAFRHSLDRAGSQESGFMLDVIDVTTLGQQINGDLVEARHAIGLCPKRDLSASANVLSVAVNEFCRRIRW